MDRFLNQIICGDCLTVMKDMPDKSVDMILCDLPYGTTECKWDTMLPLNELWERYRNVIKENGAIVLTSSQPFTTILISNNLQMFKYCWVWQKTSGAGFLNAKNAPIKMHEDICVFSLGTTANKSQKRMKYYPQGLVPCTRKRKQPKINDAIGTRPSRTKEYEQQYSGYPTSILYFPNDGTMLHPTQKPVALFEYLIRTYTNEGEIVLDNCIGSGTTAIAALNTGRFFIGMERSQSMLR